MLSLTVDQLVELAVSYKDAYGNEAIVDGSPVWEVSDASVIALEVGTGGFGCKAVTTGVVGTCQVSVTADADLGEGIKSLVATLDVSVVAAEASVAAIAVGAPVLKPVIVPEPAPAPVEPTPVEPAPVEPTPEPAPVEPTPVEPAPVEPAPVEPTPVEPAPVEPTPEPAPVEPAPVEPTPVDPTAPPADPTV